MEPAGVHNADLQTILLGLQPLENTVIEEMKAQKLVILADFMEKNAYVPNEDQLDELFSASHDAIAKADLPLIQYILTKVVPFLLRLKATTGRDSSLDFQRTVQMMRSPIAGRTGKRTVGYAPSERVCTTILNLLKSNIDAVTDSGPRMEMFFKD